MTLLATNAEEQRDRGQGSCISQAIKEWCRRSKRRFYCYYFHSDDHMIALSPAARLPSSQLRTLSTVTFIQVHISPSWEKLPSSRVFFFGLVRSAEGGAQFLSLCIRCVFMNICSRRSSEDRMRGDLFSSLARWEEFSDPSTCFRFPEGEKRGKIPSCIRFCNTSTITPTALAGGRTRCRRCRRQIKCFCTLTSSVFRVPSPTWAVCSILSGLF